jgi:hypothetical protein
MIDSHTLMFRADRAWAAYYCWVEFDRGMVAYLRQTGRSHLCKLIFDGIHVGMGYPMLRAEFDESLQDEVDLHLAVFNGDRNDGAIEAIQASW